MRTNPHARESHTTAACGSFKSFLLTSAPTLMLANPTPRQRVDPSSPFYLPSTNPETANPTPRQRVDPSSPFYLPSTNPETANPTPRQRVDPSSPFYQHAHQPLMLANPTPRQRVD